ncbi:cytochrome P450 [Gloeophyllum trabeum ATCC 11539]|uniref:Cytochrome P450 n=1 Tax=Gloeophyllum trabeum (strain ATCC 11539 / FP-39264 / Madison 617) TaxID=670483 RepID=S7Q1F1_GLOTA|nr:cytochrome P450 [Gloeophyllum trabeum ATCC 11539]EPQ53791.1 cytochrome P450 [Gloeophyllum trabeum ATCC 11539]
MALSHITYGLTSLVLLFAVYLKYSRRSTPVPPGPRSWRIGGVTHLIPKKHPWLSYARWSERFGPIISFRVYNQTVVVLNDTKAVHELLDKRQAFYSDRPRSWMLHDLCGRANTVFNISATNDRHRKYRTLLRGGLSPQATLSYAPLLECELADLVTRLNDSPALYREHIRRNAAAIIMRVAYGYTVAKDNDLFVRTAEEASQISGLAMAPGRWLVNYFPLLRFVPGWFPGAGFQRQAAIWRKELDKLSGVPHQWVRDQMAAGIDNDCFTTRLLKPSSGKVASVDEEDIIKWAAGGLYAGAADTTFSALVSFILLMAVHPDVQDRARAEILELTGADRLPFVSDIPQFHYLSAVLKEVLRFAPVAPLALPHQVTQEDEYGGYRIPKNATVMANVWSIMHDETLYPDPYTFDPSRFIPVKSGDSLQPDPRGYSFGFGRRTCPGSHFAETSMLLIMAGILLKFDISSSRPRPAIHPLEFTSGITSHIKPFDINIVSRK